MKQDRIFFLDNLKSFIILLMVVFHAAMAYMMFVPSWWYVVDTKRALAADLLVVWADVFIMPVMFFVSGYFGLRSLSHHRQADFWKSKGKRIALPWIFGSMVLAPVITYFMIFSRHLPIPFVQFYQKLFWGPAYQQAQYWYLGALLALYALLALAVRFFPRLKEPAKAKIPSVLFFLGIGFIGALMMGGANTVFPDSAWIHPLYILVLQPTRIGFYLLYFFLGAYAYRTQWFQKDGYLPATDLWSIDFILLSVVYVLHVFFTPIFLHLSPWQYLIVNALLHSFFCLSAVMGWLAIFLKSGNQTTPFLGKLAMASYPIYFIHQLVVQSMNLAVRPLPVHALLKYLLVCIVTLPVCYFFSRYVLLKIPGFAMRKKSSSD